MRIRNFERGDSAAFFDVEMNDGSIVYDVRMVAVEGGVCTLTYSHGTVAFAPDMSARVLAAARALDGKGVDKIQPPESSTGSA
jgi:hypothetical protein